ncbi:MAG: transcription-repair coupling factor [Verrucomicrobiaceae bacterium]|nr:MAG: transcription-repair coupling factor [Verrucomicrobiaceae bacterium]
MSSDWLLDRAEADPKIRSLLDSECRPCGVLGEIAEPAQPFLAALLLRRLPGRVWIVCQDVKRQEDLAPELAAWCPRVKLFPELEIPAGDALPDAETASERLELLGSLARGGENEVIVIHRAQWESPVPAPGSLARGTFGLRNGQKIPVEEVAERLLKAGYEQAPQVTARGHFARRGGILDVFSWQAPRPHRIEWFDQEIDSLREFDLDSQGSVAVVESIEILVTKSGRADATLRDFFGKSDLVINVDPEETVEGIFLGSGFPETHPAALADSGPPSFYPQPFAELGAGDLVLDAVKREQFFDQLREWDAAGWTVAFASNNEGEGERFREMASDFEFDASKLHFLPVPATRGFVCPAARLALLSDAEILGRSASQRAHRAALRRERLRSGRAAMDFSEFEEDDLVVHLDHGIGRFLGLQKSPDGHGEVLALEFAHGARLYVPLDQAWQISRYVGLGRRHPDLSELGDGRWQKAKAKASKGIYEYAARMLKIQAERESGAGHAFPPDSHWQQEFERSFLFTETPDQLRAISDTKTDMESERPMDRLICGDVGFGKTEVAIRAAFKAVTGGRQAAIITPTTVLAQQHFQTFRERMSEYPVTIELLSRYRTAAEQKRVVKALAAGSVDIVVGTHRVISEDVSFKNLGLVVVDEEQRFGVKHKDALKEKFRLVDVLTLSATPIPRTLYLSLMGARDMSVIETPPPNRQPVETVVCGYDERIIRDAITRETARGGQVYFLHNRVQSIERTAARIRELCGGIRILVGHGQMEEKELESVMQTFVAGRADVLVSTTIIESGLDIPNANTIIIDRADRFGLADLYQLRGRVGRSIHKAYAFLLLPRELMSVGAARKRVSAIKQYSDLGSGFKIAMRDLEIRGAGNLLGTAQSGHIIAVGFDLYCKLLKRAVESLKGNKTGGGTATLRFDFLKTDEAEFFASGDVTGAFIPASYISDTRLRIEAYRRVAETSSQGELDALRSAWKDRFGTLPPAAENALILASIRLEASKRRIPVAEVKDDRLMLTRGGSYILVGGRFPRLTASGPDSRLREILSLLEKMPSR